MKKLLAFLCVMVLSFATVSTVYATILFEDDFETSWSGDYAPGWINAAYRHGPPPEVSKSSSWPATCW